MFQCIADGWCLLSFNPLSTGLLTLPAKVRPWLCDNDWWHQCLQQVAKSGVCYRMNGALSFSCHGTPFSQLHWKCWMVEAGGHHRCILESSQVGVRHAAQHIQLKGNHMTYSVDVKDRACLGLLLMLPWTLGHRPFSFTLFFRFFSCFSRISWRNLNSQMQTGLPWCVNVVQHFSRSSSL